MDVQLTKHALERMVRYRVPAKLVFETLRTPDSTVDGHSGRLIAQKVLNGYILRVVYEVEEGLRTVVTVYKARRDRYEI